MHFYMAVSIIVSFNIYTTQERIMDKKTDQLWQRASTLQKRFEKRITCASNHPINLICINHACNQKSTFCSVQECQSCKHKFKGCPTVMYVYLAEQFKKRETVWQKFGASIFKTVNQMLENARKTVTQQYEQLLKNSSSFTEYENQLLQSLLFQQKSKVQGQQIAKLVSKIRKTKLDIKQGQEKEKRIYNSIKNQIQTMFNSIKNIQRKAKNLLFTPSPKNQSKVIPQANQKSWNFVLDSLNRPSKLNLLYRASEHQFSIKQFHKRCDNIENTLVLALTQHEKVIGGFTPLKWQSSKCLIKQDYTNQTFLLSLDLKNEIHQRFTMQNSEYAISCEANSGPVFGRINSSQFDLQIGDNLNNNICNSTFPANFKTELFSNNRNTLKFLTGAEEKWSTLRNYEVYQVIW